MSIHDVGERRLFAVDFLPKLGGGFEIDQFQCLDRAKDLHEFKVGRISWVEVEIDGFQGHFRDNSEVGYLCETDIK